MQEAEFSGRCSGFGVFQLIVVVIPTVRDYSSINYGLTRVWGPKKATIRGLLSPPFWGGARGTHKL